MSAVSKQMEAGAFFVVWVINSDWMQLNVTCVVIGWVGLGCAFWILRLSLEDVRHLSIRSTGKFSRCTTCLD